MHLLVIFITYIIGHHHYLINRDDKMGNLTFKNDEMVMGNLYAIDSEASGLGA